jgi:hypothetical protein
MHEFTNFLKRKGVINNEIMNFLGAPKPTMNYQKSYTDENWHEKKV